MSLLLLKELPKISSIEIDGDRVSLEVSQLIDLPPGLRGQRVVFVGDSAGQLVVVVGHVADHKNILEGQPGKFCRLTIVGSIVEFNCI